MLYNFFFHNWNSICIICISYFCLNVIFYSILFTLFSSINYWMVVTHGRTDGRAETLDSFNYIDRTWSWADMSFLKSTSIFFKSNLVWSLRLVKTSVIFRSIPLIISRKYCKSYAWHKNGSDIRQNVYNTQDYKFSIIINLFRIL